MSGSLSSQEGVAAKIPLGAGAGTRAQNDVETFLLGLADELGDVGIAGKVIDAGLWLVHIPEDVRGDGVETHGLRHIQPGAPVVAGDAGVVHLAGDDLKGLAIETELAVLNLEGARRVLGSEERASSEGEGGE